MDHEANLALLKEFLDGPFGGPASIALSYLRGKKYRISGPPDVEEGFTATFTGIERSIIVRHTTGAFKVTTCVDDMQWFQTGYLAKIEEIEPVEVQVFHCVVPWLFRLGWYFTAVRLRFFLNRLT